MNRKVPEWIGKTDDEAIPPRVKKRIFEAFEGRCQICTLKIEGKLKPAYDHIIAICNGGSNRESGVQLLCVPCHAGIKTPADVAEKAVIARKRKKHLGIGKPKRPMPGSRASGLRKRMDGTVEKR